MCKFTVVKYFNNSNSVFKYAFENTSHSAHSSSGQYVRAMAELLLCSRAFKSSLQTSSKPNKMIKKMTCKLFNSLFSKMPWF